MADMLALGRLRAGTLNKTEQAYADTLRLRQLGGEIAWYKYEAMKLKLAHNTTYTPDFAVMLASGELEMHEVKGFWRDDARVKIKVAAALFPFRFVAVTRSKNQWITEEF